MASFSQILKIFLILIVITINAAKNQSSEIKNSNLKFLDDDMALKSKLTENCWVDAYGRGVGKPYHFCDNPDYPDKSGLLCYPKCKENFKGVGPVCWQNCPDGYRDDGAYCYKLTRTYGRGVGYTSQDKCVDENKDLGCEKWGLFWYQKCRNGFHNDECCICSANCPEGMTDIGISCQKQSYGRTAGIFLGCGPGEEKQSGLCYSSYCEKNYKGIGPVCWGQCPPNWPSVTNCSGLCLQHMTCVDKIREYVEDIKQLTEDYANNNKTGIIMDLAKIAADSLYDNCKNYKALDFILN